MIDQSSVDMAMQYALTAEPGLLNQRIAGPQAILSTVFAGERVPIGAELTRARGRSYETAEALLARVRGVGEAVARKKAPGKTRKRREGAET